MFHVRLKVKPHLLRIDCLLLERAVLDVQNAVCVALEIGVVRHHDARRAALTVDPAVGTHTHTNNKNNDTL
mgnify:CR=1 FL=1